MNLRDIHRTLTDPILRQLDAGVVPWRTPWPTGLPKSLTTGKEFGGINTLVLGSQPFSSRYWLSAGAVQRLGGRVRPGQKATPILFRKRHTPPEVVQLRTPTGGDQQVHGAPVTAALFNLDQVVGLSLPDDDTPGRRADRFEVAELMLSVMPDHPEIVHVSARGSSYCPRLDRVTLPHLSQFKSGAEYYTALFHELVHSTGAEKRLDRFGQPGDEPMAEYSFEELVAEIGTAFLCAFTGIIAPAPESLPDARAQGWADALRRDTQLLVRAASAAQRAADYIRGKWVVDRFAARAEAIPAPGLDPEPMRATGRLMSVPRA